MRMLNFLTVSGILFTVSISFCYFFQSHAILLSWHGVCNKWVESGFRSEDNYGCRGIKRE